MTFPIRPGVGRMRPYSPGKPIAELARETGHPSIVKLASNENPLGPSPKAVEAIQRAMHDLNVYPDASGFAVRLALSRKHGLPTEQIALGNGSDELIAYLSHLFVFEPGHHVIVGDPSFVRYDAGALFAEASLQKVALTEDLRYDLDVMADAVGPQTRLVFIANPNNPTGTIATRRELDRFLSRIPSRVLVVLDEAYFEFARIDPDYPDSVELLKSGRSVLVLRTFSKAYGLAGLRLGYALGPVEVIDAIGRLRQPFNVNSLAQAAAIAALEDDEHLAATIECTRTGLAMLTPALEKLGARVIPSHANFVLADFGRNSRPLYQGLLDHGVIVRPGDVLGLPTCLRISIGTNAELGRLVEALEVVVADGVLA